MRSRLLWATAAALAVVGNTARRLKVDSRADPELADEVHRLIEARTHLPRRGEQPFLADLLHHPLDIVRTATGLGDEALARELDDQNTERQRVQDRGLHDPHGRLGQRFA